MKAMRNSEKKTSLESLNHVTLEEMFEKCLRKVLRVWPLMF